MRTARFSFLSIVIFTSVFSLLLMFSGMMIFNAHLIMFLKSSGPKWIIETLFFTFYYYFSANYYYRSFKNKRSDFHIIKGILISFYILLFCSFLHFLFFSLQWPLIKELHFILFSSLIITAFFILSSLCIAWIIFLKDKKHQFINSES